jgi:hypothetical protein
MCVAVLNTLDAPPATWQVEQVPVAVAGWAKVAPVHTVVERWQVSHCAVVETCVDGFAHALIETYAPLWQVAQLLVANGPVVPV